MPNPKFALKKTRGGQFMFNLHAANGQVILTSEQYKSKASATNGIKSVKANSKKVSAFDCRKSKDGLHYFMLQAANGEPIGRSERYTRPA
jgi:uncharacterized protein YegP (UPF0339 family)